MLIVIPTYKRNGCLKLVLKSLSLSDLEGIDGAIRVLIVNNFPPAADEIRGIASEFKNQREFQLEVLYRPKELPPIDNWYSAITENANADEIVFLHGDDDIFCPLGIKNRAIAILNSKADMLLTRSASRVIFDPKMDRVLDSTNFEHQIKHESRKIWDPLPIDDIHTWTPAFIGNHTYRNTPKWRKSLTNAFDWCDTQNWLDWNKRTLMLPYYLPIAIKQNDGKLLGLDSVCVLRGGDREETKLARFGVPGWNSGFLALAAYHILSNGALKDDPSLDACRAQNRRMAIQWLATFFIDQSITPAERNALLQLAKIRLNARDTWDILHGLRLIAGELTKLRGLRLDKRFQRYSTTTSEFLERLASTSTLNATN